MTTHDCTALGCEGPALRAHTEALEQGLPAVITDTSFYERLARVPFSAAARTSSEEMEHPFRPLPSSSIGETSRLTPTGGVRGTAESSAQVPSHSHEVAHARPSVVRSTKKAASGDRTSAAASSGGDSSRQRKSA